jgi:hypothetical protein
VQVLLNCLTSTLTCLCGICHLYFLKRGRECLRGINKPDRDAEFCKATDYNHLFQNRQTLLALEAILSQEDTVTRIAIHFPDISYLLREQSGPDFITVNSIRRQQAKSCKHGKNPPIFQILRKLWQAICSSYNAAP